MAAQYCPLALNNYEKGRLMKSFGCLSWTLTIGLMLCQGQDASAGQQAPTAPPSVISFPEQAQLGNIFTVGEKETSFDATGFRILILTPQVGTRNRRAP